ncbi:RcpC/CpaB family pilus assembly protein [Intrasporangium sp.]|uniref:Flp pilus assembly protein CpaB n=1 Tax=Intrasporangium sp. TaxID=1925024 RepID=UPI003221C7E6
MNRRLVAILVAVVLAVAGSALIISYVRGADARAVAGQQPVPVYVAEKLVPAGTTLKEAVRTELVAQTRVAAAARPLGALAQVDADNNNLLALSDIQPGELLLTARFGTTPVGQKAIEVPPGKLAMSVQLTDPARVGQFVTPGSHITIYATHGMKLAGSDSRTKAFNDLDLKGTTVLLGDVQVIAMGNTALTAPQPTAKDADQGKGSDDPSFLVTVAVSPDQAVRLAHGINDYTLYAGLRGADVKVDPNAHTNDLTIFKTSPADVLKQVKP